MQKTGIIQNIVPDGGYDGQSGYVNTFQMTIQTDAGLVTGQIGTKSQQYPKNIGDEIIVEVKETPYGIRLKKINPKFAQGQQQGQPTRS